VQPHGTRSRYVYNKCRCDACREANTVYQRRMYDLKYARRRPRHTRDTYTDASDVREHLKVLMAGGWWPAEIARQAKSTDNIIGSLYDGSTRTVDRSLARRLFLIGLTTPRPVNAQSILTQARIDGLRKARLKRRSSHRVSAGLTCPSCGALVCPLNLKAVTCGQRSCVRKAQGMNRRTNRNARDGRYQAESSLPERSVAGDVYSSVR